MMVRENQKYLNGIQTFLDMLTLPIAYAIAYYIRFYLMPNGVNVTSLENSLLIILFSLPICFTLYSWFDLYSSKRTKPVTQEISLIFMCNVLLYILIGYVLYHFKQRFIHFSRYQLLFYCMFNAMLTCSYRMLLRFILRRYRKSGYNLKHCLIIGTTNTSNALLSKIMTHPYWGYNIIGFIKTDVRKSEFFNGYKILGDLNDLEHVLSSRFIDIVMIATDESKADELGRILMACEKAGVKTHIIPYYYKYVPAKPYIDDLDGLPIIDTRHIPLDNLFKSSLKRCFDIIFSLFAIMITSPILIFSAIMVKLSSPGPIIYKQKRVGANRKSFYMYKFRSMKVQSKEEEKKKWTTKDDPRKTKWGSFMRRTSIDELPQFFNVLRGDMSVVGPRPERPYFVDKFKENIPRYMIKHQVRPGITGWAQVNGYRGDTSIEARIEHDLYYIENWTFGLDIRIIILTVFKGFINKNAY